MIDTGLNGRVVLVTGGNNPHGIGAATAVAFSAQGASIFIHGFRPQLPSGASSKDRDGPTAPGLDYYYAMQGRSAEEVFQSISRRGGRADFWEADLSDAGVVPQLFDRAEQRYGPVEILVNNAADYQADTFVPDRPLGRGAEDGVSGGELWDDGPIASGISAQTHDRHFAVNTRAAALMMSEFARRLVAGRKRWGRIINVSADWSWGSPGEVSYRASKHALESYTRSAAAELGPLGVTVNAVSPGPVQTGYIAPDAEEQLIASIPLRRVGKPEDVADVIVFLASEQARWVTGQVLTVHGGHRMAPRL